MSKKNVEWEWKKLKDICNINFGTRVVRKKDGGSIYPVYGGGGATFMMDSYNREDCLVVSRFAMSQQCTRFVSGKFFLNDSGLSLSPKDNSLTESFLNTTILGLNDDIYALGRGTAQKNLNVDAFKELMLPIPPLDEQERIVKVLDDAFEKIDTIKTTAETNLQNAKELFQAKLSQFFNGNNWNAMELAEVCEVVTDFVAAGSFADLRKNVSYKSEPDYAQLVRTTDLKHNFQKKDFVYVSKAAFDYLYRVDLSKESVILPNVGVNCGEVYYIPEGSLPYDHNVLGPNAVLVRSHSSDNHYLYYCFMSDNLQFQIDDITSKMAQPKFNKTSLKKLILPIPPLPIQKQIVAKLDSLSEKVKQLESNYKQVLADCDELKKAILKKAFNGEL